MIRAAFAYFGIVFALGFLLGAARSFWLEPRVGATAAVLVELPVILSASWFTAQRIVRRAALSRRTALGAGLLAFALLMIAEAALSSALTGASPAAWLAGLFATPGWIGLAGQVAFAFLPWLAALSPPGGGAGAPVPASGT